MLEQCINFFDKLLIAIVTGEIKDRIKDIRKQRNVQRKISECSETAGENLINYFRNENIDEIQVDFILYEVQQAIDTAKIDARFLANASFNEQKLVDIILEKYLIPEDIKREELERIFNMVLLISAEQLCQIALTFADWEKEAWRRNFEGFDRLEKGQKIIIEKLSDREKNSLKDSQKNIYISSILRKQVKIECYSLRLSAINSLDLVKVFVEPDIIEIPKLPKNKDNITKADIDLISLEQARKQFIDREEEKNRSPAKQLLQQYQKCAIVGVPGSGKTTLLQHIFWSTANESSNLIPVLLKVRELDLDNLPGVDDIIAFAENKILSDRLKGFLDRELDKGKVLLLIDGLDEVVSEKRDNLMKWISEIVRVYPNSKYIISSRPSDYQSETFQELDFKEFKLCDFTLDQVEEYVYKWTEALETYENKSPEAIAEISQESAKQLVNKAKSNSYVLKIATNPLMLSTLCVVQKYDGGNLPSRRVVLYHRCVEGLLFHWDKQRKLAEEIIGSLSLERKLLLLRRLAIEMQNEGIAEIEESKVEQSFKKSLEELGDRTDVKQILANIRDRSGLLVEIRPVIYAFSHLNFQEYLAALAIDRGDYKQFDRLFLFSQRLNEQWKEVIILYAGIAAKDSVEMLLEELLNTKKVSVIILSGECLAAAENVKLDIQKKVIDKLLFLKYDESDESDESEASILFILSVAQIHNILSYLERNIVKERVIKTLDNLESSNALYFIVLNPEYCYIEPLLQTGIRILTGQQQINYLADYIPQILLSIENNNAANALGKLAEIAQQEDYLENSFTIFESFWFIFGLSIFPTKNSLLKFLDLTKNTSAVTIAQTNLCKFIAVSLSEQVLDRVLLNFENHCNNFLIGNISDYEWLLDRIVKLRDRSDGELKKYATEAANNLEKSIPKLEIEIRKYATEAANNLEKSIPKLEIEIRTVEDFYE